MTPLRWILSEMRCTPAEREAVASLACAVGLRALGVQPHDAAAVAARCRQALALAGAARRPALLIAFESAVVYYADAGEVQR